MNNDKHIELIAAYLQGDLTPDQHARFYALVEDGAINIREVQEMESLYLQMGEIPAPKPSADLRDRFYMMLDEEQKQQAASTPFSKMMHQWVARLQNRITLQRAVIGFGIFVIGMLIGNWITPFQNYRGELSDLSTEVSQMREVMMMSLLDDKSATERLKAVNISTDIQSADTKMTQALLRTLNKDPNVNVRLAAVEALIKHASAPNVRSGLVASIGKQESPLVQAALADAMIILQERQSINEFEQLLDQENLDPGVRSKLENTIAVLS